MAIHLGQVLPPGSCGLPSCRPGVIRHSSLAEDTGELGRATRKADRLALLRVEIAAFHVAPHLAAQSYSSLWLSRHTTWRGRPSRGSATHPSLLPPLRPPPPPR